MNDKLKKKFTGYIISLTLLYCWTGLAIIACFSDISIFFMALISLLITLALHKAYRRAKHNNDRLIRVNEIVNEEKILSIKQIANMVSDSFDNVFDDVKYLVNHGYIKEYYINYNTNYLVEHHKKVVKVYDVTCPCCCAFNRMLEMNGKCEYCGNELEASEENEVMLR